MKGKLNILLLLLTIWGVSSCKDDEYIYPSVLTEILCVQTTSDGRVHSLLTDDGNEYWAQNGKNVYGLVSDTIYRMRCIFEPVNDQGETVASIYSLRGLGSSQNPIALGNAELKMDPVNIESIWRKGDYINFAAMVKLQSESMHVYRFIDEGIVNEDGVNKLSLKFYHDCNNDIEAYTQRVYFSIPLLQYKESLSSGDLIELTINTRNEGLKTYRFLY